MIKIHQKHNILRSKNFKQLQIYPNLQIKRQKKEPEIAKKKIEEDKKAPRIDNKAIKGIAKIIETPKSSTQKNASQQQPTSSLNTNKAEIGAKSVALKTEEKNTIPVSVPNSKQQSLPKEVPVEDSNKNSNQDTANSKKKKKRSSKKRNQELNRQGSLASDPKTETGSLEKIDSKTDLISPAQTPDLAELKSAQDLVTANTPEVNLPEKKEPEQEPQVLGNEAFLAFLKDAVRSQSTSYQKSFRSNRNKSKNKKVQKEIDYTDEDDHIAALTAFLSNRYDYAEAFN